MGIFSGNHRKIDTTVEGVDTPARPLGPKGDKGDTGSKRDEGDTGLKGYTNTATFSRRVVLKEIRLRSIERE